MFDNAQSIAVKSPTGMKKSRLLFFCGVVLAFCGLTVLICHTFYTAQKEDILANQMERLALNAETTSESIRLWGISLENQAKRVSDSELYRLFAQDIAYLDGSDVSTINDAEDMSSLGEGVAYLAEQIPMMRTVLSDFTTYNGLQDARLAAPNGTTILSAMPRPIPLGKNAIAAIQHSVKERKTVYAPVRSMVTGMVLDYASPLLAVGNEDDPAVGAFLLSVPVTGQIANFISRAAGSSQSLSTSLLQMTEKGWEAIRPDRTFLIDKSISLAKEASNLTFDRRKSIDGSIDVFSLGTPVNGLGWMVVQEIPASVVDVQLNRAFNLVYGAGAFLCLSVLLMLALVWWIMIGREQRTVAEQFRQLYQVIRKQKHLLDSINISLDVGLIMVDVSGKLHVVNRAFGLIVDIPFDELENQNLHSFVPEKVAFQVQEAVSSVSRSGNSKTIELTLPLKGEDRLFRATLFPFEDKDQADSIGAAVVTMQDITEFRRNSEKRNQQQMSTIEALVGTIERVDPYLAGHSTLMRRLVELLAAQIGLEGRDKDTLATAAVLSQIGRIFVPRDLLSKTDKLTPEEQAELGRIPEYAYNILNTIDFGMPVPAAVLQMNEKLDGSGTPNKLQGDAISLHGRILSVVNTFSAMASPRAFRAGLPVDVALDILRKNDASYDQNIVEELAVVLKTTEGMEALDTRLTEIKID